MLFDGNYILNVKFGDTVVPLSHQMIQEFTITQDIDRILPTFKLVVKDATGLMGEIIPFDKNQNKISIEISRNEGPEDLNEFKFTVDRRASSFAKDYCIQGILNVSNILETRKNRALTGNIKINLETIAKEELEINEQNIEVASSLNYSKTVLQPDWSNARFLDYFKRNVIGKDDQSGYYCFIKNIRGKQYFVFRSIDEFFSDPVRYNLMVSHKVHKNFYPILDYKIFDNSQLISSMGAKSQAYTYFDYTTGTYKSETITIDEYPSFSERILIDDDRVVDSTIFSELGRSNDFTADFKGKMKNNYYRRMTELISMWTATWGLQNISPGDIVKVVFSEALNRENLFVYQHTGFWIVKRVVHILSSTFLTNLLLIRSGIDTDIDTTLLKSQHHKKK